LDGDASPPVTKVSSSRLNAAVCNASPIVLRVRPEERVQTAMRALGWTYYNEAESPSLETLRARARRLATSVPANHRCDPNGIRVDSESPASEGFRANGDNLGAFLNQRPHRAVDYTPRWAVSV
jgi:hypothetical protein